MTEFIAPKSTAVGSLALVCLALIDPSVTTIVMGVIGGIVVITPLWFKYKIDKQNKVIEEVKKTSDGMKDELVKVTALASHATGVLEGKAQEKASQALKAEGALSTLTPKPPTDKDNP